MAGVPNTVATWWEINDQEAVAVAEGFYGKLKDEESRIDVGRAAGALEGTLVEMRNVGVSPFFSYLCCVPAIILIYGLTASPMNRTNF